MLRAKNRLKKKKEFSYIYKKGKSVYAKYISLYICKTRYKFSKYGFSVSNKVGNSVIRHKVKRRLTEIVRPLVSTMPVYNYIFVAKQGIESLDFDGLKKQVLSLTQKVSSKAFEE